MIITKIKPVSKTKYHIYIDEQFAFALSKGELYKYHLTEEQVIDDSLYEELQALLLKHAKEYLSRLITSSDQTEQQIRDKLKRKEYPDDIIEQTVETGKKYNLINDERYAQNYVSCYSGRKSSYVLKNDLFRKGISSDLIEKAMIDCDSEEECKAIYKLLEKKWPDKRELSYEETEKLISFLVRKGFSFDHIKQTMRRYLSE